MKDNFVVYLFIAYASILCGCAAPQPTTGSNEVSKSSLFLAEDEMICHEVQTNKMWQFVKDGPFPNPEEAERYAAELRLGGYVDWRLPTKMELFNLFYIHYWENDGNCEMNHKGEFWIVSKNQEPSLGHWEDYLLCGPNFKFVDAIKERGFVRAIRP